MSEVRNSVFETSKGVLYHDDCFNYQFKNEFDLVLTDPPYNIKYTGWDMPLLDWDNLCVNFYDALKDNGVVVMFMGWSTAPKVIEAFEKKFTLINWIVWDRIKGRGAKKNLVSTREDILWFAKNKDNYIFNKFPSKIRKKTGGLGQKNGTPFRALSNVWTDISPIVPWSKERVPHPTQKPLELIDRVIHMTSNEGDKVFDPFCGSGSVPVSCEKNNRKWVAIEKELDYIEPMIIKRLKEVI